MSSGTWRRRGLWQSLATVWVVVCFTSPSHALDRERAPSQYLRDAWGSETGYPGGPVYALTQGADGYLWIAAEKGLVRFDGLTFRLFEPHGVTSTAGPTVLGVAPAPDGSVWARLRGVGLVRYRGGAFENLLPQLGPPESVVSAMAPGRDGTMLLATLGQGAVIWRDQTFHPLAAARSLPSSSFVIAIAEMANGEFWLGTRDAGLLRVAGPRITRVTNGLPDLKINCLLAGPNGDLWIGTDKGVARVVRGTVTREGVPPPLHDQPALAMIRDRDGTTWIASGARGLLRMDRDGVVTATPPVLRTWRHVSSVFEDRDANLWVGTDRGIERWRDPVFTSYATAQGLPADSVGPVATEPDGRVWFAPTTGGLYSMHAGIVDRVAQAGLDQDVVYSIAGGDGEIWVGRQRGGLTRLRRDGDRLDVMRFLRADGLAQDSVYAVHRARDGAVWAGTLSAGVSRWKDGVFVTYDTTDGLASNTVASITDGRDGTLWFATPNGLSALSRGGWRTYTKQDGLPSNDVTTLFEDAAGRLWIGTSEGIAVIHAGSVRPLPVIPPALRAVVAGITEDGTGALWVTTTERLVRVSADALWHATADDTVDAREFGVADGLLAIEGVKRHRSVVADVRGRIWFAMGRGLSMADPTRADGLTAPALTHIETVSADGVALAAADLTGIPGRSRRITFDYAGLSLGVPDRVRFRYRLDGFDRDWSEPVSERQAVYTNLPPGQYRFRLLASNGDGRWNSDEAAVPFVIRPMFWQSAWFRAVVIGSLAIAGWGIYRLRLMQMARRLNLRFEERLTERTRIAQELHDTLLQGFVSASMQLHVATDRLPEDSPLKPSLARVQDLMRRVIDEGRNAVRGLRSPHSGADDLAQAFSGVQTELAYDHGAKFKVIVEGRPRPLQPAVRDEVYRIGREGLVNAFRHAGARHIELELEFGARELRLFVRDDGRGIAPEVLRARVDGHWGITGMHERAAQIGATLKVRSRAAAGTEIELRVPGRLAFERQTPPARGGGSARGVPVGAGGGKPEQHR